MPLCKFGDDGVRELLRRGLAAKVTGDSLALRNRLSFETDKWGERKAPKDTDRQGGLLNLESMLV